MLQSMQANATEHSTEHATELVSSAVLMYVGQVDKTFIALASEVLKETRLFIALGGTPCHKQHKPLSERASFHFQHTCPAAVSG